MAIPYSGTLVGGLRWYSVLMVAGIALAVWLAGREERRLGLPKDTAIDVALIAVPCGVVGARLYYVAMSWPVFAANPLSILYVWEGGVAIYGGVIGGALGALAYARRKGLSFLQLADMEAPGLLLAQALGRWGNYFNMEAYGPVIRNAAFQFFPAGVLIPENGAWVWHMATFFYESLWNVCGFAALWLLRRRERAHGSLFCWYLLVYGSGRFIIEQLREDSLYLGGFRVSEYLSLALCAIAACVLLWRAARGRRGWFVGAVATTAALLLRWAALQSAWAYAALLALSVGGCAWLCAGAQRKNALRWLCLPALIDLAGLVAFLAGGPFSASFAMRIHTLLCSLTLPVYVGVLRFSGGREPETQGAPTPVPSPAPSPEPPAGETPAVPEPSSIPTSEPPAGEAPAAPTPSPVPSPEPPDVEPPAAPTPSPVPSPELPAGEAPATPMPSPVPSPEPPAGEAPAAPTPSPVPSPIPSPEPPAGETPAAPCKG